MQWYKFSISVILLLSFNSHASQFTSKECLTSSFETNVQQEGRFFGLLKNNLSVKKEKCKLKIKFKGILETIWTIDICREPIHMKVMSKGSQSVYKREKECSTDDKSDYCYFRNELVLNLEDQGLIFADGERENLKDSHGQIYCAHLLVGKYLDEGKLFSQYDESIDLYKDSRNCEIPTASNSEPESKDKAVKDTKAETRELESQAESDQPEVIQSLESNHEDTSKKSIKPRF
jgi:hypothetical protein